jgi:hypothetical protein
MLFLWVTGISQSTPVREHAHLINVRHIVEIVDTSVLPEAKATILMMDGTRIHTKERLTEIRTMIEHG